MLYIYIYTHNLVKSLFSMKIVQNSRTFCHVYNNDDTSKSWEFKADTRYFYSNRIKQVFNKIYASESTALLKSIKSQSWLPAFYAKPGKAFRTKPVKKKHEKYYKFSQVLTYVNFFSRFSLFSKLFYWSAVILPCHI